MGQGVRDASHSQRETVQNPGQRSSHALVVDEGRLIGILTERDVVKLAARCIDPAVTLVAEVMTRQLITLRESELHSPFTALDIFRKYRIRHLPIVGEQGEIIGIVTHSSLRHTLQLTDLLRLRRVDEVMSNQVISAPSPSSVLVLAQLMATHRVSCVVLTQPLAAATSPGLAPVGIVTERDIVQFQTLELNLSELVAADVMSTPLICLNPQDDLWEANQTMKRLRVRRLVVANDQGMLVGIVTQTSILSMLDPFEMQNTITILQQQVEQLKDERIQLLQNRTSQLETRVEETETRFQAIFNQTFQFIGLLEPDGTLVEINQTALDFGSLQREEVINRPFWEGLWWKISPETQAQLREAITRAAQGDFVRYEVDVLRVDRIATIDFSLRPIKDHAGQVKLIIPEGRDISDRKRAEAALLKSEQHYANLAEAAPVGIFETDADGQYFYVNNRWCGIVGITLEESLDRGWIDVVHMDDQERVQSAWLTAMQTQQPFRLEYRLQPLFGSEVWVFAQAVPEIKADGHIAGYVGTITDITERKQAELALAQFNQELEVRVQQRTAELEASRERYRLLYKQTPVMLHSIDWQGYIRSVSNHWLERLGYAREEVIGRKSTDFLTPDSRQFAEDVVLPEYFQNGFCTEVSYQMVTKTGEIIDVLLSASSQLNESGQPLSLAVIVDVTERNRAERALFREKELAQITLHSIADAVITTDASGRVEYFNPVAEQLTGWNASDAKSLPLADVFHIVHEITKEPIENPLERVLQGGDVTGLADHALLISKDQTEHNIEDSAAPIRNREGKLVGAVMVFHDVTQSRQLQNQLSWQAGHDALTGLTNRRKFEQELTSLLQEAQQDHQTHFLCYLDLDQFKVVNDTCGHTAGDELLRQISRLLASQIRASDILARLGGDEFGVLLRQCSLSQAETIAEKVRKAIQNFRFVWQEKTFRIGSSLGLASLDVGTSLADTLNAADSACYAAKNRGRNRIHIYQANDTELAKQRGEQQWSVHIRQALEENRFCLYSQVIMPTCTRETPTTNYHEVLLRMFDEQGELVSPGAFIPAAERYNLMPLIDRWVIQTFFRYVEHWQSQQSIATSMTSDALHFINLSGASLEDAPLLELLKSQLGQHDIPPQSLVFEITETAAISNLEQATHFIRELKHLGCKFALDDFGSGMSSFGYLKNLPVDFLKIDGNFIKDIVSDSATYAIVESINHVGHVMNLETIAEYVEDQDIRDKLVTIGVDYVQGYGVAHPACLWVD